MDIWHCTRVTYDTYRNITITTKNEGLSVHCITAITSIRIVLPGKQATLATITGTITGGQR
jgi:hypothetical protein